MMRMRGLSGFTLIELLIVIAILAIIMVIALPAFQGPAEEAKEAAIQANLSSIRRAIEMYNIQHDDNWPDTRIYNQLTQRTDIAGAPGTDFGPYIMDPWPGNPKSDGDKQIRSVSTMPVAPSGTEGWIYDTSTGDFRANSTGTAPSGTDWFDL